MMGKSQSTEYQEVLLSAMSAELDRLLGPPDLAQPEPRMQRAAPPAIGEETKASLERFGEYVRRKRAAHLASMEPQENAVDGSQDIPPAGRDYTERPAAHRTPAPVKPLPEIATRFSPERSAESGRIALNAPEASTPVVLPTEAVRIPPRNLTIETEAHAERTRTVSNADHAFNEVSAVTTIANLNHPGGKLSPKDLFNPRDPTGPFGRSGPYGQRPYYQMWLIMIGVIQMIVATTRLANLLVIHSLQIVFGIFLLLCILVLGVLFIPFAPFVAVLAGAFFVAHHLWKKTRGWWTRG